MPVYCCEVRHRDSIWAECWVIKTLPHYIPAGKKLSEFLPLASTTHAIEMVILCLQSLTTNISRKQQRKIF